jgi:hypothetical protein
MSASLLGALHEFFGRCRGHDGVKERVKKKERVVTITHM